MAPSKVLLSEHAIDRYAERVKPNLSREAAERELRALIDQGELRAGLDWSPDAAVQADAYLILVDGIALALTRDNDSYWAATTTLTRGGVSPERAARRRERRRKHSEWVRRQAENKRGRAGRRKRLGLERT